MKLTPGVHFLVTTGFAGLFGPPLFVHALLILVSQFWSVLSITPVVLTCTYLFALPTYLFISSRVFRFKEALAARRFGARVTPRAKGILPGNVDLLYQGLSANKTDYLGEPFIGALGMAGGGTTFTVNILGDNRVLTMHPKNIQKILATEFEMYRKGKLFNRIMEVMLGVGVFNSDGDMWQFHRKSQWDSDRAEA